MTIDIPTFNEDGSIKAVLNINPEQAQHLLQFAINFLAATGLASTIAVSKTDAMDEYEWPTQTND